MKNQLLNNQGITPLLQPLSFTTEVVSHRSSPLSFCFLLFTFLSAQNLFAQYTYSTPGTYLIDDNGNNPPMGYGDGITVEAGVTLIIENREAGLNLVFNNNKGITVDVGAHLIVRNSILETNSSYQWSGIYVDGSGNGNEQYLLAPLIPLGPLGTSTVGEWEGVINNTDMGWVEFYGSTIDNAANGIRSVNGGVIWVDGKNSNNDATFLNCKNGVLIEPYLSSQCQNVNACHIMQADFLWDTYNTVIGHGI